MRRSSIRPSKGVLRLHLPQNVSARPSGVRSSRRLAQPPQCIADRIDAARPIVIPADCTSRSRPRRSQHPVFRTGPPFVSNLLVYPCRIVKRGIGMRRHPSGLSRTVPAGEASAPQLAINRKKTWRKRLTPGGSATYNPRSRLGRRSGRALALSASPSCKRWVRTIRPESGALFDIVDIGKGCAGGGSSDPGARPGLSGADGAGRVRDRMGRAARLCIQERSTFSGGSPPGDARSM